MANNVQEILKEANETDKNKELFSDKDLKAFTDLVTKKEDFDLMVKGFEDEKTIKEVQAVKGLKDTIDTFIKTKTGLADIFSKEYDPLGKDQDLYEVCLLGALLDQTTKITTPDYKVLAKAYYDKINPAKIDNKVEVKNAPNYGGNFVSGSSEIKSTEIKDDKTNTNIETKTAIEKGNTITAVTATVSAGADLQTMPLEKAKADRTAKLATLKGLEVNFTTADNKKAIEGVITDLGETNIKAKIKDELKSSTTNDEQLGNRYLIGARIAQGFIDTLNTILLTPEPTLTLAVDRDKCIIGKSKNVADVKDDRFIGIYLTVTNTKNAKDAKEQVKKDAITTPTDNKPITGNDKNTSGNDKNTSGNDKNTSGNDKNTSGNDKNTSGNDKKNPYPSQYNETPNETESKEKEKVIGESPDIFIAERVRISLSKDFKWNGKAIDKDKDIKKITKTAKDDQFYVTINDKDVLFSFTKIDKDRNFDKDNDGNVKVKETDKKYYEAKLETTELKDKFKVYDVKADDNKNITTTLNEEKTKTEFKKYYTFKDTGYSLDTDKITITKDANSDLESIKTNIKFTLPATILANQTTDKTITEDVLENVIFDKNGEVKTGSGNTYEKFVGKNKLDLLTKEKDVNDNYKKENKNMNYSIKTSGKEITIINDEVKIDATSKIADWNDNRMASVVENADKTQETFKNYAADLDNNFKKRQINALGGDEYQLLVIPNITGVDESQYITMKFSYKQKPNTQTQYFSFKTDLVIPEKYKDAKNDKYFVIDNLYYKVDVPKGDQTSINPRIVLDYTKTKTEALNKTNNTSNNQIKELPTEKIDNNAGGAQDRNIALINNITYNSTNYLDFSIDETDRSITYSREISLDEVLGYDKDNKNKLVLGTIKFNGNGEIIETTDRNMTVNKKNQTLEIKDIFGWNKTLTIPFEIKDKKFVIGTNSNDKAKYITEEFTAQKEYLKNRIYDEKALITTKINEKITEIGTQRASEFPGLKLAVPKEGKRKESNTPTIDSYQYLKGPTSKGLYYLELSNGYQQGKDQREEEFLYFKVSGKDVKLTDMNGNEVEETYIQSNKEYKPNKGLVQVKNDLTITTITDVTEQEKGYPTFIDAPETLKNYLTKTVDDADATNYDKEVSGNKYLRIFGNSKIGHITSIPIKAEDNNKNKYLYNKEGLKPTTADDMAKDLRDYDEFKTLKNLGGLKESELKEIFMTKFKVNENIDKAISGDNIRIKNNNGKYEYRNISSKDNETIKFKENTVSKEIQEKVVDDMKKDLTILGAIENIKFKYRRNDENKKTITPWDKAGNRTIKDIEKQTIQDFINTEDVTNKKIKLHLLGPAKEDITLDLNDKIYQKLESKDINANGYYKNLFEKKLGDGADKTTTVQKENYKAYLQSNEDSKEYWIIFESQVEKAQ